MPRVCFKRHFGDILVDMDTGIEELLVAITWMCGSDFHTKHVQSFRITSRTKKQTNHPAR
jgi:hypothetical protein